MKDTISTDTFESREHYRHALSAIKKNNFEDAANHLQDALKIAPDNAIYLSHYGYCTCMNGDYKEAESTCERAIRIAPGEPMVYVNMGKVLLEEGLKAEARQMFLKAYRVDNTNTPAALELSRMGIRRPPVIKMLARSHPFNILLGKLRHRLLKLRNPSLKKLK